MDTDNDDDREEQWRASPLSKLKRCYHRGSLTDTMSRRLVSEVGYCTCVQWACYPTTSSGLWCIAFGFPGKRGGFMHRIAYEFTFSSEGSRNYFERPQNPPVSTQVTLSLLGHDERTRSQAREARARPGQARAEARQQPTEGTSTKSTSRGARRRQRHRQTGGQESRAGTEAEEQRREAAGQAHGQARKPKDERHTRLSRQPSFNTVLSLRVTCDLCCAVFLGNAFGALL